MLELPPLMGVDQYLDDIRAYLSLDGASQAKILEEIRAHLEDSARALQLTGLSEEESEAQAMKRFGDVKEVGERLRQVHGRGSWDEALLAAGATLLFALLAEGHHILWLIFRVRVGSLYTLAASGLAFGGVSAYAWRRDLPRWCYPWLGYALLWVLFSCGERTLGRYVAPSVLLLSVLLVLSSKGFGPLARLARAIWRDWTLGSFVLFPATMFLSWLFFDGTSPAQEVPFVVGIGSLCGGASAAFVLARSSVARAISLAQAVVLSLGAAFVATSAQWLQPAVGRLAVVMTVTLGCVLSPVAVVGVKRLVRPG